MYGWSNKKRLQTLDVGVIGRDVLLYTVGKEKAEICIKDNDIDTIIYSYGNGGKSILTKDMRHHIIVGDGVTKRDVYHYLLPNGPAPTLRIGITKHCDFGTWSSLPHDFELHLEPGFEEIFFYILEGGSQRAIQIGRGMWCDGEKVDAVWPVCDRTFSTIPMGYHAVVGEPGVRAGYIWAYVAKKKEWEKV